MFPSLSGRVVRLLGLAWLVAIAPAELAASLTSMLAGPSSPWRWADAGLVVLRVAVTALGLRLGVRWFQDGALPLPTVVSWAVADLVTLTLVLATGRLAANRMPGSGPWILAVYGLGAAVVVVGARRRRAGSA